MSAFTRNWCPESSEYASRLVEEESPYTGNITYAYDAGGNRTSKALQGGLTTNYTYNDADQLTSDSSGNSYSYNVCGELTSITNGSHEKNLTWDGKGRLSNVIDTDGLSLSYTYDPLDRTYASTDDSVQTVYAYDMTSDIEMATIDTTLDIKDLYFSGTDGLISDTNSEGTSYSSYNPHSDTALVTDSSGTMTLQMHYDAWGNKMEATSESNNYLGKYQRRDYPSANLIKMGARFYDPDTGRFISRDPLKGHDEIVLSHNQYSYTYGDPINQNDINGMTPTGTMSAYQEIVTRNAIAILAFNNLGIPFHMGRRFWNTCPGTEANTQGTYGQVVDRRCDRTWDIANSPYRNRTDEHLPVEHQIKVHGYRHPKCFDCSGFVEYIFWLANYSSVNGTACNLLKNCCWNKKYKKHEARKGDLAFGTGNGKSTPRTEDNIIHAAIYLGGSKQLVIETPGTGAWVLKSHIDRSARIEHTWNKHVVNEGGKRDHDLIIFRPLRFAKN